MNCKISSLYICVKDMERAISFYEQLFGMPVTEKDEIYSVFEVGSFRFGLFAYEKKGEPHEFGSNCLPSISFESLGLLKEKLKNAEICFELTKIRTNWVAEIIDSEGNHIELTAPDK